MRDYMAGLRAAELAVPETVVFERDIEFANPDNRHLQVNLARPKGGDGPFPAGGEPGYAFFPRFGFAASTASIFPSGRQFTTSSRVSQPLRAVPTPNFKN